MNIATKMKRARIRNRNLVIFIFILPGLLIYAVLLLTPLLQGIVLSTYKFITINQRVFVGIKNYIGIFNQPSFWNSMKNTAIFTVGTVSIQIVVSFIIGYFIYMQPRFYKFYRTIFFIPAILSPVAIGFVFGYMVSPAFGLLKGVMDAIGIGALYLPPLAYPSTALITLIFVNTWQGVAIPTMMFNAGLMNIPEEVIESASLDGASGWKMIYYMIIPLVREIGKTIVILQLVGAIRSFDLVYIMTGGGPMHSTELLPMNMFVQAFQNYNFGYGNAIAVVIFTLCLTITLFFRRLLAGEKY